MAKEAALVKQKEALKGSVSSVTKKPSAPAPSKQLTVETENKTPGGIEGTGKSEKMLDKHNEKDDKLDSKSDDLDEDEFSRDDDEEPMTRE